jgi:hypothetical protein
MAPILFTIFNFSMIASIRTFSYLLLVLIASSAMAQEALTPKPSPLALIKMRYKDAYVRITYSQPHKNGRDIFGSLVPYGQVWRTGANDATELTTTKDILIGEKQLKAGTYSIFTIPEKDKWTIIVNSDLGLWGSYNYNEKLDVIRFEVPVKKADDVVYEPFTMKFEQKNELADLLIMWDNVRVTIPVKFNN